MSSDSSSELSNVSRAEIVDVRLDSLFDAGTHDYDSANDNMSKQIIQGLSQPAGNKELPTLLLYTEQGLRLYDDITTKAPEYYLFGAEQTILKENADEIVRSMHGFGGGDIMDDEVVLELGAGSLRKTSHILLGLSRLVSEERTQAPITYYALDLELAELERTLGEVNQSEIGKRLEGKVDTKGMLGTYDDGLKFIQRGGLRERRSSTRSTSSTASRDPSPMSSISSDTTTTDSFVSDAHRSPLHILFLGSSLGNFSREDGMNFLLSLPLRAGSGDTLLIGLDHDNGSALIEDAYNDPQGYTRKFIMNGLTAAGNALGDPNLFNEDTWDYVNVYNETDRRHEAYYKSKCAQTLQDPSSKKTVTFIPDELLRIELSHKFSEVDAHTLFTGANLRPIQRWTDPKSHYSLWLLERPLFIFPLLQTPQAPGDQITSSPFGVPSMQDWDTIWAVWDFITLQMVPRQMLMQKPIDLRHIILFYLGHIPAFLDIQLSKLFRQPHTEPEMFKDIFERGIDPNVDDPTIIHPHSIVPEKDEDWPSLDEILQFQSRVRARLANIYKDIKYGRIVLTRSIARILFMAYEHEGMHFETLLYMLLQRAGSGTLPPTGFTAPPFDSLATNWDSAPTPATAKVTLGPGAVTLGIDDAEADDLTKPVAGHKFAWDNENGIRSVNVAKFSIEWRPITNGQFCEFYKSDNNHGGVQLPASWVEQNGVVHVRTLYGPVPMKIARDWPVLTSFNDLSKYASVQGGRIPTEPELRMFYDKFDCGYEGGSNVGLRNWHPVPATTGGERSGGKGHNGGVWEWTSTNFDKYEGFVTSTAYPGYSADFFDGAHKVVLGGSYVTIPRIAERRSFRNWYQANYNYAWVGARIAYDL